ncbi:uncharacterized protein RJT20DRAFT_91607 [Scheffersomyces xylosifermentans]|uniref:uncharacterized protein n=1 Tax=Scheffersomyces xylosifermentans TaxID=1304137 RepID=UPI00315D1F23
MKFGNNLQHLSIPEWRCYNIDYNDLKYQIRQITQSKSTDLKPLHRSFVENFDYINLFVATKYGELVRKFNYFDSYFSQLVTGIETSSKGKLRAILIEIDEIFYQIVELSLVLKNLSKFIIIQKIAVKKIFKKFLKYYNQDKQKSVKFVINLKNYLLLNKMSFINFDLSDLTLKLTNIITSIKYEQKHFYHLIHDTSSEDPYADAESAAQAQAQSKVNYHIQQDPVTSDANFDLMIFLKKNFSLNCLIPDDSNTLNEIILNLNIYLNFKNYNINTDAMNTTSVFENSFSLLSYIYLTNESDMYREPSFVITQKNQSFSIVIAHIGGLRKYSYCILPNEIVQLFLSHLIDRKNDDIRSKLFDYFNTNDVSPLTRKTIDAILSNNLKPSLKLICKRARYILKKSNHDVDDDEEELEILANNEETGTTKTSSDTIKRKYQDDYLVTLDHGICTTNSIKYTSSLSFCDEEENEADNYYNNFETFPHNHLTFYSNDSNLCNFENSLETQIDVKDGLLFNTFSNSLLGKLPKKIQNLILHNNFMNLFKQLNFYQYMISCYFNLVPRGDYANNHYTYLLNLNLLKNFEDIENFNKQLNSENSLIKAKSNRILRHQLSIRSLDNRMKYTSTDHCPEFYLKPQGGEQGQSTQNGAVFNSLGSASSTRLSNHSIFTNNQKDDEEDDQDENEALRGISPTELSRFRQSQFGVDDDDDLADEEGLEDIKFLNIDEPASFSNYDSINEEPTSFLNRNKFVNIQYQYELDYDQTLSYIYFSLNLLSIFLSGIELGIVYSVFMKIDENDSQFLIINNLWLILVLIMGLLLSLIFSMISINLIFQRYHTSPLFHTFVVWSGFSIVCMCCIGSIFIVVAAGS